jgi:nucleoside-diphosphate-sugar epimerase
MLAGEMGARVLIAGCGFVGAPLAERLAERGCDVFALRRSALPAPRGVRSVRADLSKIETLDVLPEGLDVIVYMAGPAAPTEVGYRTTYLDGVDHLLRIVRERGELPRRMLFCSSTAVYAQHRGEWVDETSVTRPLRFSGEILLSAERLLHALMPQAIVVRLGGIYGPGRTRLIDGVRSGDLRIRPGEHFTNRIHRDDAAGVLERLALAERPGHGCYLAVDDEPADEAEVLRYLADRLGVPEPRPFEPGSEPSPRAGSKRCRNARVRAEGYSFAYPTFREGYAAMLG